MTVEAAAIEGDPAEVFRRQRIARWDETARSEDVAPTAGAYYHRRLAEVYAHLVFPGLRVLELGCGRGDLLASLKPSAGVGVDFSPEMLARARARHPGLRFVEADVHELSLGEEFDAIILSDLVNDLWDIQTVLTRVRAHATPRTRVILNSYSRLWQLPLAAAEALGLARPVLDQSWLTVEDLENLLHLADFEVIRRGREVLWPLDTPLLAPFLNEVVAHLWPFEHGALTNMLVVRPRAAAVAAGAAPPQRALSPRVSVVVPARNEAGNIEQIFTRTPQMGGGTELVFVEGHSKDDTFETIRAAAARHPERESKLMKQPGAGKGDAVRLGFQEASGEVLMILDADLTVPPEDLPRFYEALVTGKGEFVNGVRLVYPMEGRAMRFLNLLGNKFFSLAFSWLLGQTIKDTLCGTKVLWKSDYEWIAANRSYFGDFDPFGDFDLIFGAARASLRIVDLPIRYRERTYGTTNIQRWKHGLLLLRMLAFAARKIRFV